MMNRREFLRALGFTTAALVVVPLVPTPFLPVSAAPTLPIAAAHLNTLVTPEWAARQCARLFEQQLRFAKRINRAYDESFQHGATIDVRLPERYRR